MLALVKLRTTSEVVHHNSDQRERKSYVIGSEHVRGRFPEFVCRPMAEHCQEAEGPRLEEKVHRVRAVDR